MYKIGFDIFAYDHASAKFNKLGRTVSTTEGGLSRFNRVAKVALAAVGVAAIKFGKDSVSAYLDAEKSQRVLLDAYGRFPAMSDKSLQSYRDLSKAIELKTGFDDDEIAAMEGKLGAYKLTGAQIQTLSPLVVDLAAKLGVDVSTAAGIAGKALLGQGRGLKQVGINFKDTGSAAGNYAQLQAALNEKLGGFAEKEGRSAEGRAKILKVQFEDLQESVGAHLVPALTTLTNAGIQVLGWMERNSTATKAMAGAVGGLVGVLLAAAVASKVKTAGVAIDTAATTLNTGIMALSRTTLATWIGVKALELGAWVRSAAATVAATAATLANAVVSKAAAAAALAWSVALKVVAAAQWLLNAALTANPIGLVIAAIALLVVGLVVAYKKSETFRKIVDGALHAVARAAIFLWNGAFAPAIRSILRGFAWLIDGFANVLQMLGRVPGFGWATTAANKMRTAAQKAREMAAGIRSIPNKTVTVTARTGAAESRLRAIRAYLASIHNKSVAVTVNYLNIGAKPQYQTGGYTGPGGHTQVAGIVHKGEYVMDAATVSKYGVGFMDALRGGTMGGSGTSGVAATGAAGDQTLTINLNLNGRTVQQVLLQLKRETGTALGLA